ncbi:MAG: binding-protein-dependent transport system inner rane component [Thermomicrobiales bacterium]|jgi:multiple sugar transport system permease protein|nr:binding-protein-dependent transport system inner rane component [Thermomicrobiales bacterium]MDF3041808.1 binding-protein-dependent transport system inner rane component [Thermomicrobiales bacterium]
MMQSLQPGTQPLSPQHPITLSPSLLQRARRQSWLAAYLFLAPALLGLAIFRLYPIALAAWGSLHTTTFGGGAQRVFVGLDNYRYLLDYDVFWQSLTVTLKLNLVINPLQIGLALLLAVLANQRVSGITFYRTIFFIPIGISVPIAALLWQTMLDPNTGLLNALLSAVGLPRQPFLTSADQALWAVVAIASWKGVSFWMVFLLGGLQAIPGELHEAAMLDGASATRRFFQITLPLLKRTILFVLVTDTAINLLLFAPIYLLTRGGPELSTNVLMYEAFKTGFVYTDMGLALAMVMVLLGLVLVVVAAEFRLLQTGED